MVNKVLLQNPDFEYKCKDYIVSFRLTQREIELAVKAMKDNNARSVHSLARKILLEYLNTQDVATAGNDQPSYFTR